jgi:hypothetical protein
LRNGKPDPGGTAGDDCGAPVEVELVHVPKRSRSGRCIASSDAITVVALRGDAV